MLTSAQQLYSTRWRFYVAMIALIGHRRSLKRFFKKRNILTDGMKIVDAGCGSGALMRSLWELAQEQDLTDVHFLGFDLTPEMLDQSQKWIDDTHATHVHLSQADLMNLPLTDDLRQADLLVTAGMLEYIPKDQFVEALRHLRGLLKNDGRLFVFVSRTGFHNELLVGHLWHANLYSQQDLLASFQEAQLLVVDLKPFKTWGFAVELQASGPTIA